MTPRQNINNAARLCRAVCGALGGNADLIESQERPWASATFSGARHIITVRIPVDERDSTVPTLLAKLPDYEFNVPGEIVADCVVSMQRHNRDCDGRLWLLCTVELLTILAD